MNKIAQIRTTTADPVLPCSTTALGANFGVCGRGAVVFAPLTLAGLAVLGGNNRRHRPAQHAQENKS